MKAPRDLNKFAADIVFTANLTSKHHAERGAAIRPIGRRKVIAGRNNFLAILAVDTTIGYSSHNCCYEQACSLKI
jgi:hypothetical protein